MITLRKLATLKPTTALRKTLRLLEEFQAALSGGDRTDLTYLTGLCRLTAELLPDCAAAESLAEKLASGKQPVPRDLFILRAAIENRTGAAPADWDMGRPASEPTQIDPPLPLQLLLEDIRSPFNVGSIFRSAAAFNAAGIILTEECPPLDHSRAIRSSMGTIGQLPARRLSSGEKESFLNQTADEGRLFALELGGRPVSDFEFPDNGIALLGSEELGVSPEALAAADRSAGRVSIPLPGSKGSLNVGVAAGILLSRWSEFILAKSPSASV